MKIKFVQEARIDGKVAFEKDSIHDLAEASAQRWVSRGIAKFQPNSAVEKVLHKAEDKLKEVAHKVAEKLEEVAAPSEPEHSDGAAKQEEIVANDASVEENKANKKAQVNKNGKGL